MKRLEWTGEDGSTSARHPKRYLRLQWTAEEHQRMVGDQTWEETLPMLQPKHARCLWRAGFLTADLVATTPDRDLRRVPNLGATYFKAIRAAIPYAPRPLSAPPTDPQEPWL